MSGSPVRPRGKHGVRLSGGPWTRRAGVLGRRGDGHLTCTRTPGCGALAQVSHRRSGGFAAQTAVDRSVWVPICGKPEMGFEPMTPCLQGPQPEGAQLSARAPNLSPRLAFCRIRPMDRRGHLRSKSVSSCCNVTARNRCQSRRPASNRQPPVYKTGALPIELRRQCPYRSGLASDQLGSAALHLPGRQCAGDRRHRAIPPRTWRRSASGTDWVIGRGVAGCRRSPPPRTARRSGRSARPSRAGSPPRCDTRRSCSGCAPRSAAGAAMPAGHG